jgi:hypothetical protein
MRDIADNSTTTEADKKLTLIWDPKSFIKFVHFTRIKKSQIWVLVQLLLLPQGMRYSQKVFKLIVLSTVCLFHF